MRRLRSLRPAGNRIDLCHPSPDAASVIPDHWHTRFVDSGTSALGLALKEAVDRAAHPDPIVLLPAYGCPDLLSATVFAGARARLVDLMPDRPWLDHEALQSAIDERVVAIVAVNFLGIEEQLDALQSIAARHGIPLIHDCAQSFQAGIESPLDTVILSFGRGKPVSLLGGGAVLTRMSPANSGKGAPLPKATAGNRIRFRAKATAYNLLARPGAYWIPERIPFLRLGETRYKALENIAPASPAALAYLQSNAQRHTRSTGESRRRLRAGLGTLDVPGLVDLPARCNVDDDAPLLRYPLLLPDKAKRDAVLQQLRHAGLGASSFYDAVLPDIEGVPFDAVIEPDLLPNARSFAERLLTLPCHDDVESRDVDAMLRILKDKLAANPTGSEIPVPASSGNRRERISEDSTLRVMHIASGDLWAGAEMQIWLLLRELKSADGIEPSAVLLNDGLLAEKLRNANIPVTVLDERHLNAAQIALSLRRLLRDDSIDVLHTHRIKENILGSLVARSRGCRSIRTVHGRAETRIRPWDLRRRTMRSLDYLCGLYLQDRVVSVSHVLADELRELYPANKIIVVPNTIDREAIQALPPAREKAPLSERPLEVAVIGRLVPVKRIDLVIDIAEQLERDDPGAFRFFIYGDGPLRKDLETQALARLRPDTLRFMGFRSDILECLQGHDALLITSDHEGLPTNLLEAIALGKAVVARGVGEIPMVIPEGRLNSVITSSAATDFSASLKSLRETLRSQKPSGVQGQTIHANGYQKEIPTHRADRYASVIRQIMTNVETSL